MIRLKDIIYPAAINLRGPSSRACASRSRNEVTGLIPTHKVVNI